MEEKLDILNEKGEKTGESRLRKDVHRYGLLHLTAHVWFVNSKRQLLIQKRSKTSVVYPGFWDGSASGHVSAGQSSLEGAQRETQEELGVSLTPIDLKYLFTLEEHIVLNSGTYINNEFQDVYLVHSNLTISEFKIDPVEVEEIRWIDIEELKKWICGDGEKLAPRSEEYKKLLGYLQTSYLDL